MSLIYLAHPNDALTLAQKEHLDEEVRLIKLLVEQMGLGAAFDPIGHCSNPMGDAEAVWSINEMVLDKADGVVAFLPPGVPSIGTPMEVLTAAQKGKPLVVIGPVASLQLEAMGVKTFTMDQKRTALGELDAQIAKKHKSLSGLIEDWQKGLMRSAWLPAAEAEAEDARWDVDTSNVTWKIQDAARVIKWMGDEEYAPQRHYGGDAGLDLIVAANYTIRPGETVDVDCGIYVELPPGTFGRITGRSSTLRKKNLHVAEGIIDNGYRGRLWSATHNLGEGVVKLAKGDRIAQLILHELAVSGAKVEKVNELSESDRMTNAFGSTG